MKPYKVCLIAVLCGCMFTSCGKSADEAINVMELSESDIGSTQMTQVIVTDLEVDSTLDAQIGPKVEQLTFPLEGIFKEYLVRIGDTVTKGQVLATTYSEDLTKQLEQKEKELADLKDNYEYERQSIEYEMQIIDICMEELYAELEKCVYQTPDYTRICLELGNYDVEKKKKELQLKQKKESYQLELPYITKEVDDLRKRCRENNIVAPFDGTVVALYAVGEKEEVNDKLYYVAVADTSNFVIRSPQISQGLLSSLSQVLFWYNGKEYQVEYCKISDKDYMAMRNNGEEIYSSFSIVDADEDLQMGGYGKLRLISKKVENVLVVPNLAIRSNSTGKYVYQSKDGKKTQVYITTGSTDGIVTEVTDGLKEGDTIYVQE